MKIFGKPRFASLALVLLVTGLVFSPSVLLASPSCETVYKDVPGKSTLGSASTWANLRSSEDSIKKRIEGLLNEAEKGRKSAQPPQTFCPSECDLSKEPKIVFQSIPNKFDESSSDDAECKSLFSKTKQSPLKYEGNRFATLEDLNSWFADFSQGKGKQGSDLYTRCPGDCSPQYTNLIDPTGKDYLLRSDVVCGPARDKSDNQYKLSVAYRWICQPKA